tara:strand:- start:319 stop:972 length:654 start_codon:yes stop_codon:yes gene_type:complete
MIEIAIDGTAASGKGTLARKLAEKYNFIHLDTGLLYRKVANELIIKKKNISKNLEYHSSEIARNLNFLELKKEDLRSEETAKLASLIATQTKLREILNLKQKEFVEENKKKFSGCILDGRDIGTKILPNADFKFFIDASIEVRAKRRLLEKNISFLHEKDEKCMLQSLIKQMNDRDKLDIKRSISPLVPAEDAYVIDTTFIDADELFLKVTKIIDEN